MQGLFLTTCIALVLCSPVDGKELPPFNDNAELASLEFVETSWGRPIERISISPEGHVRYEIWDGPFSNGPRTSKRDVSFTLTRAQHAQALDMLSTLRSRSRDWVDCENMPTDGPYGSIKWNGVDTLNIYMPCLSNPELTPAKTAIYKFRNFINGLQAAP